LIGGDPEETEQEPEQHEITRQRKADHFIRALVAMDPGMDRLAYEEMPDQVTATNTAQNKTAMTNSDNHRSNTAWQASFVSAPV